MTAVEIPFYAPLKSPEHPKPSGDRAMARALIAALEMREGAKVFVASHLQTRNGQADQKLSEDIIAGSGPEIRRLISIGLAQSWPFWVTYHNYYKAPDLIGPAVSDALNIPYVQIESTRARKRLSGPWAQFAQLAEAAADHAALIFYMTQADREALEAYQVSNQRLAHLKPFLARQELPEPGAPEPGRLLAAGMMRVGDKMASYQVLAAALAEVRQPYHLAIAGDGPARSAVEALFPEAEFLGQLSAEQLAGEYGRAQAFVWPGVNEAYGMVYLEAQAHGVPVIAEDRPGVRDVVRDVCPVGGMAERIEAALCGELSGEASRARIGADHLLGAASGRLWAELEGFL